MIGPTYGGMSVMVSPALPIPPTPGEQARRSVRHAYAASGHMEWLGLEVGPRPGVQTHAVLGMDPAQPDRALFGVWFVSAELYEQLKAQAVAS